MTTFGYRGKTAWRVEHPLMGDVGDDQNGCALIPGPHRQLSVLFSAGEGWEHVSVSTPNKTPNWSEMCFVKDLFWPPEACVIQFHPPKSDYVNVHSHCLHLWRPTDQTIPMPPKDFV